MWAVMLFADCASLSVNAVIEPWNKLTCAIAHADQLARLDRLWDGQGRSPSEMVLASTNCAPMKMLAMLVLVPCDSCTSPEMMFSLATRKPS